jgi:hypothetical protein
MDHRYSVDDSWKSRLVQVVMPSPTSAELSILYTGGFDFGTKVLLVADLSVSRECPALLEVHRIPRWARRHSDLIASFIDAKPCMGAQGTHVDSP